MTDEQFSKARELHEKAALLVFHKNQLQSVVEHGIDRIQIYDATTRPNNAFELKNYNNDHHCIKNQPEAVQTLLETFPSMLIAAYEKDIKKLEKEFSKI